MLVLGPKEAEAGEVAVRERKQGNIGEVALDTFIEQVLDECAQVHQQA